MEIWGIVSNLVLFHSASVLEHFEHVCDEKVEIVMEAKWWVEIWGIVSNLVLFHCGKRF